MWLDFAHAANHMQCSITQIWQHSSLRGFLSAGVSPDILICLASHLSTAAAVHNLCAETHKVTRSHINLQLGQKLNVVDLAFCSVLTSLQQTVDKRERLDRSR